MFGLFLNLLNPGRCSSSIQSGTIRLLRQTFLLLMCGREVGEAVRKRDENGREEGRRWKSSPGAAEGAADIPSGQRSLVIPQEHRTRRGWRRITPELLRLLQQHPISEEEEEESLRRQERGAPPRHRLPGRRGRGGCRRSVKEQSQFIRLQGET